MVIIPDVWTVITGLKYDGVQVITGLKYDGVQVGKGNTNAVDNFNKV